MKRLPWILGAAVLLALGLWWFSPTQKMKRRVTGMIETANVPPGMPDIARNTRGPNLEKYLAKRLTVAVPDALDDRVPGSLKRDSAVAYYSLAARGVRQISLEDLEIEEIIFEGDDATVRFQVDAIVELPGSTPVNGILHVDSRWQRDPEEGWRMRSVSWEETGR